MGLWGLLSFFIVEPLTIVIPRKNNNEQLNVIYAIRTGAPMQGIRDGLFYRLISMTSPKASPEPNTVFYNIVRIGPA